MKELNAGMKLSGTNMKASITNRTNLLKRRHENKLYFMKMYGISLPLQKLYMLREAENCFSYTTIGLATNYTDSLITEKVSTTLAFIWLFFLQSNRGNSHYAGDPVELTISRVLKNAKITG